MIADQHVELDQPVKAANRDRRHDSVEPDSRAEGRLSETASARERPHRYTTRADR